MLINIIQKEYFLWRNACPIYAIHPLAQHKWVTGYNGQYCKCVKPLIDLVYLT